MHNKYISVKDAFEYFIFDDKITDSKSEEYKNYQDENKNSIFFWKKSRKDDKLHISRYMLTGFGEKQMENWKINMLFFDKEQFSHLLDKLIELKSKDIEEMESVSLYQECNKVFVKRADVNVILTKQAKNTQHGIIQVVEVQDELSVYQSTVSKHMHDIKNQMTMMLSMANNIQKETDDESIKKYVYFLKDTLYSCNYMLNLTDMDKELRNTDKLFNMHHIIKTLQEYFRMETEITFYYDLSANNPRVYANRVLITNALYNIIINAIQELEHEGSITIRTYNKKRNPNSQYKCSQWLFIEIEDNGQGVPDEIKDKIFEPNFTTKLSGSGLGLYNAKVSIVQHKGTVNVKSSNDKGAVFIICLPSYIE